MKKNISIVLGLAFILFGTSLFAAGSSPMEIFTNREGEIILKKYSPIGEIDNFAKQYAESLAQVSLTGAMSAMMQKIMPFIVGCVCCLIMALSPDIATAFGSFDFLSSAGVTAGTTTP